MFKKVIQIVQKLVDDDGELQSVTSAYESMNLDGLSIVKIVESRMWFFFKKVRYVPTGVTIQELHGTDTVDVGGCRLKTIGAVDITSEWQGNAGIKNEVATIGNVVVDCQLHDKMSTKEIKLVSESHYELRRRLQNRTVDEDHFLFQEMQRNKAILDLGVVYEVMKIENTLTLEQTTKQEGGTKLSAKANIATVGAGSKVDRMQKLHLNAGCVLGFKVHPLNLKTTKDPSGGASMGSDGVAEFREEVAGYFPKLKRCVEVELGDFGTMDRHVKKHIWDLLYDALKFPQALSALDCMLEGGCVFTASSPLLEMPKSVHDLLEVVGLDSAGSPNGLIHPIGFLVGALSKLDEDTVTLIVDLDRDNRGQLLNLVEGVLEQVCSTDGGQRSGQFSENITTMATQVLTSCGLTLGADSLDPSLGSPGAPDEALLALYITIKGLNMLLWP